MPQKRDHGGNISIYDEFLKKKTYTSSLMDT